MGEMNRFITTDFTEGTDEALSEPASRLRPTEQKRFAPISDQTRG